MRGIIPADGSIEIVATFTPTKHRKAFENLVDLSRCFCASFGRTARSELQFHIAQFQFEPVMVGHDEAFYIHTKDVLV